ncbi:MAG TPA: DUF2243 domain-containing protein [Gemmatirosa sp.]
MTERRHGGATAPGLVIGVGLGGLVDGWLLHQILQWHNMLSARIPPTSMAAMRANMTADGFFDAGSWAIVVAGVVMLWAAGRRGDTPTGRRFAGQLIAGWGLFNLVEGVIDHHLLQLHHVIDVPAHVPLADWLFLAVGGVLLLVVGGVMARADTERASRP